MQSRGICLDRSPKSMQGRFAYHIMGNLDKFKKTEAQLIEADEKAKAAKVESTGRTVPKQRYSPSDDKAILSYIINNQEYSKVRGNQLWETMEEQKVVKGRGFMSLQGRFQDHIMKNLNSYGLTDEQISFFEAKKEVAAGQSKSMQKWSREEDDAILSYITHNQSYSKVAGNTMWMVMAKQKVLEGRSWRSMQGHFLQTMIKKIESYGHLSMEQRASFKARMKVNGDEEEVGVAEQKKGRYTKEEDKSILAYITTNQEYARVGSRKLWKDIEKEKVVPGRGRKSMMNRFPKIMEKVGSYGLTEEQISSLKKNLVVKDKEEEMMDVGETDKEGDNLAMGMNESGIEDQEEGGESNGMSEEEEEEMGDLHGQEEMEEENFRKENSEDEDDDNDEEGEPHKAYILVDF